MSKKAKWSMKHSWTQPYQGMNCREVYDTLGWYEGFGLIQTRDSEKKLFEIIDQESNKKMIVPWDQCWDIDEAELVKE